MRVLITGSSGFVGKHVVRELVSHSDHDLLMPTHQELNLLGPIQKTDGLSNDILFWFSNCDAVVHLAATCGGIGINKDNPGKFIYENLQMGINVLEAARIAGVRKVVNLGTVCAYPKHTPIPFQEKDLWSGYPEETNAPYGIAKKTIMEMGIAYSRQYGMNITNLVPANMAGEYDHFDLYSSHVIPALIRKFENPEVSTYYDDGEEIELSYVALWGTGSASREFLYASDCARAIALSLEKDTGPEPINLGTGHEITIRDLARLIQRVGDYRVQIVWDTEKPDGQPRRCIDSSRARDILGWEATTSLETTIQRTIDWYRANHV